MNCSIIFIVVVVVVQLSSIVFIIVNVCSFFFVAVVTKLSSSLSSNRYSQFYSLRHTHTHKHTHLPTTANSQFFFSFYFSLYSLHYSSISNFLYYMTNDKMKKKPIYEWKLLWYESVWTFSTILYSTFNSNDCNFVTNDIWGISHYSVVSNISDIYTYWVDEQS